MGDTDDLDDWETDAVVPVDAAIGIIPSWLEAALSTEAAGCPLHARAAYAAIMRFFIGSPTSKGLFFRQLWRDPDPFNQMRESLGAIMRVLAVKLVDPALPNKFPFPLVAFTGDQASSADTDAFVADAELRFIDASASGTGPSTWFRMLVKKGAATLGTLCADAPQPVPGLEEFKTPEPSAAAASAKADGKKINQAQEAQILDGKLLDPARVKRLLETTPAVATCLKATSTRLKSGANLMGIKIATPADTAALCDWPTVIFFDPAITEAVDKMLNSYILPMKVSPASDYAGSFQPMALALNARDDYVTAFMKASLSMTEGPAGRRLRIIWRDDLMQPSVDHDRGSMSRYSLSARDLRGHEASSQRPIMLSGSCFDDLWRPAETFLRGISFHSVRVADHTVRKGLRTCMQKFYDTLIASEHSPGTAFVLIRTRVLDRAIDALVAQLERLRASPDALDSNEERFFLPKIQSLFDSGDWGVPPADHPACPAAWRQLKRSITDFREAAREYHPGSICKAFHWHNRLSQNGSSPGTPRPISMDSAFSPMAVNIPSGYVLVRQPTNIEVPFTFDSRINPNGLTELYMFAHLDNTRFENGESYYVPAASATDCTDALWLPSIPEIFAPPPVYHGLLPVPVAASPSGQMAGLSLLPVGSPPVGSPTAMPSLASIGAASSAAQMAALMLAAQSPNLPSPTPGGPKRPIDSVRDSAKKGKGKDGKTKPRRERLIASSSIDANAAVERELAAYGLCSNHTHKQIQKHLDTKAWMKRFTDISECPVAKIHSYEDQLKTMPLFWRPDEGWTKSLDNKIKICQGDLHSFLFPTLVTTETLFPGCLADDKRVHIGCPRGSDCYSRHVSETTRAGEPWPAEQQLSAQAIQRIRGILGPELYSCFTDPLAEKFNNYLGGTGDPDGFLRNDKGPGLGVSPAKLGPPEHLSAAAVAVHDAVYNP